MFSSIIFKPIILVMLNQLGGGVNVMINWECGGK